MEEKDRRRRNSSVRRGSTSSSRAATPVWDGEAGSWAESGQAIEAVATGLQQGLGLRAATRSVDTPGRVARGGRHG